MVTQKTLESLTTLVQNSLLREWLLGLPERTTDVFLHVGRKAKALLDDNSWLFSDVTVTKADINKAVDSGLRFSRQNRAGLRNHFVRISRIPDATDDTIGLTVRFNSYEEYESFKLLQDVEDLGSLLIVAPPGYGKTSYLRYLAKFYSETKLKNTVIVDKSNEICGEGIVPDSALGEHLLRLQVPESKSYEEMIVEAIENHHPHILMVDEISRYAEAMALRGAYFRGVDVIATCHGSDVSDVLTEPQLNCLLGSVSYSTVSDSLAKAKYDGHKTKKERKFAPIFSTVMVIKSFDQIHIYKNLEQTIDLYLDGGDVKPEIRTLRNGEVHVESQTFSLGQ